MFIVPGTDFILEDFEIFHVKSFVEVNNNITLVGEKEDKKS